MKTKNTIFIILLIILAGYSCFNAVAQEKIRCCYYDIDCGDNAPMTKQRKEIITEQLRKSKASIIVLAGLRDKAMLDSLLKDFKDFTFSGIVETESHSTRIAMIAKIKPKKFEVLTDQKYNIKKGIPLPVERGFIHAVFDINGYILHIFGANLKDRTKDLLYNQYDMRRYEARALRKLITAAIKEDKKHPANILLLAGLNDSCAKAPVKDIYNRRFGIKKRLFDLRPVDSLNVSWTYLNDTIDEYERIDFAIVSFGIIPEIIFDDTVILENPKWYTASTHRLIIVTVIPVDKPEWSKEKISTIFPKTIKKGYPYSK